MIPWTHHSMLKTWYAKHFYKLLSKWEMREDSSDFEVPIWLKEVFEVVYWSDLKQSLISYIANLKLLCFLDTLKLLLLHLWVCYLTCLKLFGINFIPGYMAKRIELTRISWWNYCLMQYLPFCYGYSFIIEFEKYLPRQSTLLQVN